MKTITCHKCGHKRKTNSKLGLVTCTNCGTKITIRKKKPRCVICDKLIPKTVPSTSYCSMHCYYER